MIEVKEQLRKTAKALHVEIDEGQEEKLLSDIESTLKAVENLSKLDTENVPVAHAITQHDNVSFEDGAEPSRTFTQEEALSNAKNKKNGLFVVPKILSFDK